MKSRIIYTKIVIEPFNIRCEETEERINEPEHQTIEIIEPEKQIEKE